MPSKRKKNRRRMRRDQAQKWVLEDQYGSSGKGAPGTCAVSTPVTKQVPVDISSEPPPALPVKTPVTVVAPVEVQAKVPAVKPIVEEVLVTDTIKDEVLKTAQDLTEAPVEPPVAEPAVIEETESITVPVLEVTTSIDEPLPIPSQSQIRVEDTGSVTTEMHIIAEPVETPVDTKREVEAVAERPAEESVVVREEKLSAVAVKPATETAAADVEPVTDAVIEVYEPAVEVVRGPAVEAEAVTAEAEPLDIHTITGVTQSLPTTSEPEKMSLEAAGPTEATEEPGPEQQAAPVPLVESTSGPVAEGFLVTGPSLAVEACVSKKQIPETTTDTPEAPSQTLAEIIPAPELELVPKEIIQAQDEFVAQVETEAKKDLAVDGSLTVDTINGCLAGAEVASEG